MNKIFSTETDLESSNSLYNDLQDKELNDLNEMLEARGLKRQSVDDWLREVNYKEMNSGNYVPSQFALNFVNFIKLVNGTEGEQNLTPVVHLKMLDEIAGSNSRIANLCHRGIAKTTLMFEYFAPYVAVFGELDNFGEVEGIIYISDSMENGVKSARKNLEHRYHNSEFLQKWLPVAKFTDNYIEFQNTNGHKLGIKLFGAKALALNTPLFLAQGGTTTIGECQVGDVIMGADGKPTKITKKSEIFHKPMYELKLQDGRTLKVSEDHLNQVHIKRYKSERTFSSYSLIEKSMTTEELIKEPLFATDPKGSQRPLVWVQNTKPMEWPENQDILIDPYTVGALIGDGSMNGKTTGQVPVVLTAHEDDWPIYEAEIPYDLGKVYRDKRNPKTISRTVKGINTFVSMHGLDVHGSQKKVPDEYLFGSIAQRLALLQGLMDTDGTCTKDGKSSFCSASKALVEDVMWLVRSLGGEARWMNKGNTRAFQCSIRLDQPLFRIPRKLERQRPPRNDKIAIVSIERIEDEPSQCIAVDNDERQFAADDFFRTHNTGLRGTKMFGKRPTIAILDDLVSDDDAKSKAAMEAIKDTVYKGVNYALDPGKKKIIFSGTPFNKNDILYEAVESGGWSVNVYPVCEKFPCKREDFHGSWEDRFTYDYVLEEYQTALATGKISGFMQELMLKITSEEERMVQDDEIHWYSRKTLLQNKSKFNFYITTDFATKAKEANDLSVISVWAYSQNRDWYWVDGFCEKALMNTSLDALFRLCAQYRPQSVGIEVSGQQGAFIQWIQEQQMVRNVWFNLAQGKGGSLGIRPETDKLSRFNLVVPLFKAGKIKWPEEMKASRIMGEMLEEVTMATMKGFKSKDDDFIDTISQLAYLTPWAPSELSPEHEGTTSPWEDEDDYDNDVGISTYIV